MTNDDFTLRPVTEADLPEIYRIESSELKCLVGDGRVVTEPYATWVEEARSLIRSRSTFALDNAGTFAGYAVLKPANMVDTTRRELMLLLSAKFVGERVGSAACRAACRHAFEQMRAEEVLGTIWTRHTKCIDMVKRLGFNWRGTEERDGRWMEHWVLGRAEHESASSP